MDDSVKPGYELTPSEHLAAGLHKDAVRCFRLLTFASQRLRYLLDQELAKDGLTSQQGFLLTLARAMPRPSMSDLAAAMSTTHQNVKQMALALERKGMLRIVTDENDGRVRRIELSEEGAMGWRDRDREDFAVIGRWFSALSTDEQAQLAGLLARLARSIR